MTNWVYGFAGRFWSSFDTPADHEHDDTGEIEDTEDRDRERDRAKEEDNAD